MNFEELEQEFNRHNLSNEKNSMERLKFCWKLIESDDDKYLETHLVFLEKANKYFAQNLQGQFKFRKDKKKVFHFFQKRLKQNVSPKLHKYISQIINEIDFKSIEQFKRWLQDIKTNKRDDKMEFVWSIMKSPYIEFHYNLMKDERDSDFGMSLRGRFDEHRENGAIFLLDKLDKNEDIDFHGEIIFQLGCLEKYHKDKTLKYARKFAKSKDYYLRDRAIIVLGLVGSVKEYPILKDRLLNDKNINCRAWSASAFMQLWFKNKSEELRLFALSSYREALVKEDDSFVLSTIIESTREIENNKFGISKKSLENLNTEDIQNTKERIKRYIDKKIF